MHFLLLLLEWPCAFLAPILHSGALTPLHSHLEYRQQLIDHVLRTTVKHWELDMRSLGAQSLRIICALEPAKLIPGALDNAVSFITI